MLEKSTMLYIEKKKCKDWCKEAGICIRLHGMFKY